MPFNVTLHTLISSPKLYGSLNKHDTSHPLIDETLYYTFQKRKSRMSEVLQVNQIYVTRSQINGSHVGSIVDLIYCLMYV